VHSTGLVYRCPFNSSDISPAGVLLEKYHMHKTEREMTDFDAIWQVLRRGKFITFALSRNNEPYILTLSYGLDEENRRLYFHTALKGLKLEILKGNPKAAGTVIEDLGYVHGECSHRYSSVVLFGDLYEVEDISEKKHGMFTMFHHLEDDPDSLNMRFLGNDGAYEKIKVLRFDIYSIRGKTSN
jgi:nitroimidazol reductase NimA-like FMN-containing flavoprotein (pyridoxamine 5'-phosphate oxidase superfamily)